MGDLNKITLFGKYIECENDKDEVIDRKLYIRCYIEVEDEDTFENEIDTDCFEILIPYKFQFMLDNPQEYIIVIGKLKEYDNSAYIVAEKIQFINAKWTPKKELEEKIKNLKIVIKETSNLINKDLIKINQEEDEKQINKIELANNKLNKQVERKPITVADFIVRSVNRKCLFENHELKDIKAVVAINTRFYGIKEHFFDASYCPICNKYFLLRSAYDAIIDMGIPCCNVINDVKMLEKGDFNNNLNEESILRHYGYTVNAQDDLSEIKRENILSFIIENNIASPYRIISFLEWLIRFRGGSRKNMKNAIKKWSNDVEFVKDYKIGSNIKVKIRSIFVTDYYYVDGLIR